MLKIYIIKKQKRFEETDLYESHHKKTKKLVITKNKKKNKSHKYYKRKKIIIIWGVLNFLNTLTKS